MSKSSMPGVDSEAERTVFGRNFRARRQVYQRTGVAQSHISEIEAGGCNVAIDTMVKLAAVAKLDVWRLLKP